MSVKWEIDRTDERLILSRGGRKNFDVSVQTDFPNCGRERLAHQVRQDLWRALQNTRGLSPVVSIERIDGGLRVTAGGEIHSRVFPKALLTDRISRVLLDPINRARWFRFAAFQEVKNA